MNLDRGARRLWIGLAPVDPGGSFLLLPVRIVMLVRKTRLDIIGKRKTGRWIQTEGLRAWHVLQLLGFHFWGERRHFFPYISYRSPFSACHLLDLSLLSFISSPFLISSVCAEYFHLRVFVSVIQFWFRLWRLKSARTSGFRESSFDQTFHFSVLEISNSRVGSRVAGSV